MVEESKLKIEKYFSKPSEYPIEYTKSDTTITDDHGKPIFVQKDVEFPNYFSGLSRQITASRYFYGEPGTKEREGSFKQLVERVTSTYEKWASKQKYFKNNDNAAIFKEELDNLSLTQKMAFNSPVWFNVGTDKYDSAKSKGRKDFYIVKNNKVVKVLANETHLYPQTSACFIQGVDDTMEDIMDLAVREAKLFKYGSGTGTDLSTLRSSKEKLSGGGKPSGPLAYEKFYDCVAGIVKSGGKTRRAAKMNSLRIDHPDIKEFIEAKMNEEKKIRVLIQNGYSADWGKEAVETAAFQNANFSVRVTDDFMNAVEKDEEWQTIPVHNKDMKDNMPKYKAKDLFRLIAEGTHLCGDPGLQYHTTINKWHTCPESGEIKASNPCSEYMFINDSSCNLASLNLRGFVDENGKFNVNDFKKAIRTTVIAMDLNYDNSSFPTRQIAENSKRFRPLGLGHCNVGGLLMALGIPYDSDKARDIAAGITSLMTSTAYKTSIEMAKKIGTFEAYNENKKSMIDVIKMHSDYSKKLVSKISSIEKKIDFNLEEIASEADKTWNYTVKQGSKYGFRNAQASVLAPTGTIGFLMDADTKGIEPEIGLVQTKLLAEGGTLRMVNGIVPLALKKMGYDENKINEIISYINKNETAEGCDVLKQEDLAVFDCANKPEGAKRAIHYQGHLKMMAAVQPFLSGAISKTVNMPKEATVEEIENAYMEAWKLGLKAVAIYRDGSKARQPMSFSKKEGLENKINERSGEPFRKKLPGTANSIRHKFNVAGHEGYMHVGLYEDNTPGELFITMSKEGSTVGGLMDVIGTSISMNLQYGAPLATLVNKFKNARFEPLGYVAEGHSEIKDTEVTSVIDYIFKFMEKTFIEGKRETKFIFGESDKKKEEIIQYDINTGERVQEEVKEELLDKFCPCGAKLVLRGHCQEICSKRCGFVNYNGCSGGA